MHKLTVGWFSSLGFLDLVELFIEPGEGNKKAVILIIKIYFQRIHTSISHPAAHRGSLLRVTILKVCNSSCLVPLSDGWFFFFFHYFDPLWHSQRSIDRVISFTGLWEENVLLFERNQTTAGAEVSGDLHWSDPDPGHDSHHYSALGSLLWQTGAWDRPNDGSEEWHRPAPALPLSGAAETEPVEDLWTHSHGEQLQHTFWDGGIIETVKEGNHTFISLDLWIFWTHT